MWQIELLSACFITLRGLPSPIIDEDSKTFWTRWLEWMMFGLLLAGKPFNSWDSFQSLPKQRKTKSGISQLFVAMTRNKKNIANTQKSAIYGINLEYDIWELAKLAQRVTHGQEKLEYSTVLPIDQLQTIRLCWDDVLWYKKSKNSCNYLYFSF